MAVNIVDTSLNQADTTSSVTFTFSEAPVGFTSRDITVANGTVTGLTATANPLVWSATFTATAGFEGTGSVSVNPSSYSNAAGNPGSGATDTVAIDTQPPAPTITLDANITSDDIINIAETGQNIPVTGVVGGDAKVGDTVTLTVNGKTFTGLVAADKTFSINVPGADLAADADKTVDASITTTDAAGNSASSSDTESYSVAGSPSVAVNIVDTSLNQADTTSSVTFTFSEAPVGFTSGDITVANGTVTGLTATANPLVWSATFTATAGFEGTGSVSVNPSSYSNAAGNPGSGATDTVAIDTQPPAPTITLDANITSDDIINIAETGQNIPVTGVVGGDAKVGDTVTLTVNGKTFTGLVAADKTFSINVPGADLAADADKTVDASITTTDAAGNSASTDTESYSVAGSPSVAVNIVDTSLNQADTTSSVTFTFSEAPVGFTSGDITVANGTVTGLTATANPLVWSATFTATAGFEGTGSVSVNPSSYSNAAGNPGSGATDTVAIDTQPPAPTITLDANITSDDIINIAETGQNIPVTGVVGGDAKVGDTVTLTVNGKTFTGLVAADKTFSINVPGADLAADADKTVDASITTTDAAGNSALHRYRVLLGRRLAFRGRQHRRHQPEPGRYHVLRDLHFLRSAGGLYISRHHRRQWHGHGPHSHCQSAGLERHFHGHRRL